MSTDTAGTAACAAAERPWDIDALVGELLSARTTSRSRRHASRPSRLPSQRALANVVDGLTAALFPHRLDLSKPTAERTAYAVGRALEQALGGLSQQIRIELEFHSEGRDYDQSLNDRATGMAQEFARHLPGVRRLLDDDINAAFRGDPAARSVEEVLVCYPGVAAITHHRLAHVLHNLGVPFLARMVAEFAHSATGIDIHPGARIGGSFFIDHGTGVVIGESCVIGKRVRLYQAVTLGAKRFEKDDDGVLVKGTPRHPIVEDDVVIYAGATILGRITIGRGSSIGGNVWVTRSVPPGSNLTQAKTRLDVFIEGAGI